MQGAAQAEDLGGVAADKRVARRQVAPEGEAGRERSGQGAGGVGEAIQRGALLRITEQKLRSGDVRGTRLLLERLELEFPEQKLEGMYRFLRAETDRFAGRYEEATGHYEVLLKLRQWAGFRDRAIHRLAECSYRQEDFAKAQTWLDKLKESFPEYYELRKLTPFHSLVKSRAEQIGRAHV